MNGIGSAFSNSQFSRRSVLHGALGLSAGLALASLSGCAPTTSPASLPKIKPVVDGDITWFTWEGYVDDAVLAEFEKEYGVKVSLDFFDSDDTMLQKVGSGLPYDLITNNSAYMQRSIAGQLIQPVDYSDLKNFGEVVPFFENAPYDNGDARYSIPYGLSSTGILLRTDKLDKADGWDTLWTGSSELAGHVTVLPQTEETIGMSLIRLGYDLASGDQAEVAEAIDELLALKPGLLRISSDTENDILGGDAWVAHTWPGSAYRVLLNAPNPELYDFIQPAEGVPFGGDVLTIGAKAKSPGTAMLLMDWLLRPENAARNVTYTGYPNGTKTGDATYAELVHDFPFLNMGDDVYETAQWKESPTGARLSLYTEQWNRFIA